ncbi:MAG TPA: competence/damage-inducible protein A [Thermoanaerobacterales bacterium]|nr:competence/damage-inducible protein A [Thermoanaerobacterales bacterium]
MDAEIISVGTELLLGQTTNTNAQYLSKELSDLGINVYFQTTVGDNESRLKKIFIKALDRSDIIIFTGGLGPTQDDITKEVVAKVLGLELIFNTDILNSMDDVFRQKGLEMSKNNEKQALIPKGAIYIENNYGTAPGIYIQKDDKTIILLPGPPKEMGPMVREFVLPKLRETFKCGIIKSKILRFAGIGESALEEAISDIIKNQSNPTIAPLAKEDGVTLRITAKAQTVERASAIIDPVVSLIKGRVGNYIYSYDNKSIQDVVGELLLKNKKTISLAESCTGGYVTHLLTNVPGISAVFDRSIISYSNTSKLEDLNVPLNVINDYGAVSENTAILMASGIRGLSKTDFGVGITGIAGPSGGSAEKPVGLVFIALSSKSGDLCERHLFSGDRETIKKRASRAVFNLIWRNISK